MRCSCCGAEIAAPIDPENFDEAMESVRVNGEWVRLTKGEWDILYILRSRMGSCVSHGLLYDAVYGYREDKCAENIKVFKLKLQRKLAGSKFEIKTFVGRGYALVRNG